jgi:hypothetical protein
MRARFVANGPGMPLLSESKMLEAEKSRWNVGVPRLENELYYQSGYRHCATLVKKNPAAKDPIAFIKAADAPDFKIYLTWRLKNSRISRELSIDTCWKVLAGATATRPGALVG